MAWLNEEVAGLLREYAELIQITAGDVINTWPLDKLRAFLRKGRRPRCPRWALIHR